jgi:hypothetical protein
MYVIEDWLRDNVKINISYVSYVELLNNIFLFALVYILYSNVEFTVFLKFIKYYILFLCIRYILSSLTTIKESKNNKRYFQINSHVGLFLIIILICIETNTFGLGDNPYLASSLIIIYSVIIILTKYGYTYDVIISILLVHYMFNLKILKELME